MVIKHVNGELKRAPSILAATPDPTATDLIFIPLFMSRVLAGALHPRDHMVPCYIPREAFGLGSKVDSPKPCPFVLL